MNFLNDLLAAWGNGQTPFAQDQMQTMQSGGMPIPDFVNAPPQGLPSMVGSMPRTPMPLQKPMLAGSGNSEGMSRRPPAAVVSGPEPVSADLAAPSFATTLSGALQGASRASNPLGAVLGGIGGALGAGDAVNEKNQTFRLLKARGLSDADAALAVKNPQYMQQLLTMLARKEAPMSEADQLELEKKRLEIEALKNARPNLTKDAPTGTMWVDPNDQSKGVRMIPGYEAKPDPIEVAIKKDELARSRDATKADDTRIKTLRAEGDQGREVLDKIARLREARKGVSYEGGFGADTRTWLGKNLPDVPGPFGLPFIPSRDEAGKAEQIGQIATELQLGLTNQTKGAISDREMALFGSSTPGMAMSDAGANNVMLAYEAGGLRQRERPKFYEAYRKTNGSLEGADEAWDAFVQSKPILEPSADGFKVNQDNIGAWREFVGGEGASSGFKVLGVIR